MSDKKFTLEQRLAGIGLHAVDGNEKTMTFTRDEIEKFLAMVGADGERDPRVKFVVEIGFSTTVEPMHENNLRVLLADALGEFPNQRLPAREYVVNRHPYAADDPERFEKKVAEVERRCHWARKMDIIDIKKI